MNCERVDFALHQGPEHLIDHPVPRDLVLAGETGRDDGQAKVAPAGFCALVAGVPLRFVQKIERLRLERSQPLTDRLDRKSVV